MDIVSAATNVTSTVTTNDEGRFSAPFLLPGAYRVTAEKTGFKRFVQSGVEVRVSETTELNIGMQTGELSEAIEVTASTPLLDTAGSSLGQVIDERRVQELPLFAGNPMELTLIAAGVVNATDLLGIPAGSVSRSASFAAQDKFFGPTETSAGLLARSPPLGVGNSR